MSRTWRAPVTVFAITILLQPSPATAQIAASLARLESTRDETRMGEFYRMLHRFPGARLDAAAQTRALLERRPGGRSEVAGALIRLLERENARARLMHTRAFANYRRDLAASVAALGEPTAVGALVGAIRTGPETRGGIVALGAAGVGAVARASDLRDAGFRYSAVQVLGMMAAKRSQLALTRSLVDTIRTSLLDRLQDSDARIRRIAVESLGSFDEHDVAQAMERLAATDVSAAVRDAASEWLRRGP